MDWIHCNGCFVKLQTGVTLFLTSCGHMFCQSCLDSGSKGGVCKICQSQCTTMKLAPDMPPDVQDFFSEPSELISKLSTILDFQRKHRMKLTSHWISTSKKFAVAKDELKRLNILCHKLNDAVKEVQQKNRTLKEKLHEIQSQAISPLAPVLSPNMSDISPTLPSCTAVRPAKSTPNLKNSYQSSLVTPDRVSHNRSGSSGQKMMSRQSIKSGGVLATPSPPTSAGSGYFSGESYKSPPSPAAHQPPQDTLRGLFGMLRWKK